MRISVLTLFPEMFAGFTTSSIVGRSIDRQIVSVDFVQIRDFAKDRYKHVDDKPFGGGAGMVMKCQPVVDALNSVRTDQSHVVMMSPSGVPYTQEKAHELAGKDHLVLLCGHYEGMDARIGKYVDEEISIGDYVLTGGELASMVIMDSVIRLLEGSIKEESTADESYENGLLEYPQYTQPREYGGECVPSVLLSGNHQKIREYRRLQSLLITKEKRPDLFAQYDLSKEDIRLLERFKKEGWSTYEEEAQS